MKCFEIYATYKVMQYLKDKSVEQIVTDHITNRFSGNGILPTIAHVVKHGWLLGFSLEDIRSSECVYHIGTVLERNTGEREYYKHGEQMLLSEVLE